MPSPPNLAESRARRNIRRGFLILAVWLALESPLPPRWQPSAWLARGLLGAYQSVLSPLMGRVVRCKFRPSCSHYALGAVEKHGTLWGVVKTAGRLWRCSPWGPAGGEDQP